MLFSNVTSIEGMRQRRYFRDLAARGQFCEHNGHSFSSRMNPLTREITRTCGMCGHSEQGTIGHAKEAPIQPA